MSAAYFSSIWCCEISFSFKNMDLSKWLRTKVYLSLYFQSRRLKDHCIMHPGLCVSVQMCCVCNFVKHSAENSVNVKFCRLLWDQAAPNFPWLNRAGLRLQGKQLLPTNHPSLLETGFSPPSPPPRTTIFPSCAALTAVREHMSAAASCLRILSALGHRLRCRRREHGGMKQARSSEEETRAWTCVCEAGWETVRQSSMCSSSPTLATGVGFMWLPACLLVQTTLQWRRRRRRKRRRSV